VKINIKLTNIFEIVRKYSISLLVTLQNYFTSKNDLKSFVVIISIVVGIISGLLAVVLKKLVHFFQYEPAYYLNKYNLSFLLPITPLIGILLSILIINIFFKGQITKGIANIIYVITRKRSDIPRHKILSHLFTSAVTIGMGGSAGLEAPIVAIGGAIGSNIGKDLKFTYKTRTLLLACGSAAGIAAVFNCPIAGVIFALEVLLPEITISSFIPLLLASASSTVISKFLYEGQLFYFVTEGWHFYALPYYLLLGAFCGLVSIYIIKVTMYLELLFTKPMNQYLKAVIGGTILCGMLFLFPPLYGEGYSGIVSLLNGNYNNLLPNYTFGFPLDRNLIIIFFIAIFIFLKPVAASLTISSGGNGGIIAPSLFIGAFTGFLLAFGVNFAGFAGLNLANFIVVGMAGVLSGVLHAPLTGIFLIAEITGGYVLIVPLMIVTALSYAISKHFNKYSVYTSALAKKGIEFRPEREKYSFQELNLESIIENNFTTLVPNMTLGDLIKKLQYSKRNIFPVLNESEEIIGIVTIDDIREYMLDTEVYNIVLINEIMSPVTLYLDVSSNINELFEIFSLYDIWALPITKNNKYLGFVSKSSFFNKYLANLNSGNKEEI